MMLFDGFWEHCAARTRPVISTNIVEIYAAEHWPLAPIERALTLLDATLQAEWVLHAATTAQCDIAPYLQQFSRNAQGKLALPEQEMLALYDAMHGVFRIYDFLQKRAAIICPPDYVFSEWELYSPFREFFHLWALSQGGLLLHSGVVCAGDKAVVLVGAGGAGKSTTVLSCLEQGMTTTGDDYNLILPSDQGFIAVPLFANIKVKNPRVFDFTMLESWPHEDLYDGGKTIYYPPADAPLWNSQKPRVVGILCPSPPTIGGRSGGGLACTDENNKTTDGACNAPTPGLPLMGREINPAQLLSQLAISSIMQSPYLAQDYLAHASLLAKNVKSAKLPLSPRAADNVARINEWMSDESECDHSLL